MEEADLSSWMGKPPEKRVTEEPGSESDGSNKDSDSVSSASTGEVNYDGTPVKKAASPRSLEVSEDGGDEEEASDSNLMEVDTQFNPKFYIDIQPMTDTDKDGYCYLPGHFAVDKILSEYKADRYLVKLMSGERQIVSALVLRFRYITVLV
jgi:hypothetical protein